MSFFPYDPAKREERDLFDPACPAFTMSFNASRPMCAALARFSPPVPPHVCVAGAVGGPAGSPRAGDGACAAAVVASRHYTGFGAPR